MLAEATCVAAPIEASARISASPFIVKCMRALKRKLRYCLFVRNILDGIRISYTYSHAIQTLVSFWQKRTPVYLSAKPSFNVTATKPFVLLKFD